MIEGTHHSKKDIALWTPCIKYFQTNPSKWHCLANIMNGKTHPSLRLVFFFVTTYLKDTPVVIPESRLTTIHDAYSQYRHMLKVHTKQRFDPFCRRQRFDVTLHNTKLSTNVGQLVFFRWFFETKLYEQFIIHKTAVIQMRSQLKHNRTLQSKKRKLANDASKLMVSFNTTDQCSTTIRIAVRFH